MKLKDYLAEKYYYGDLEYTRKKGMEWWACKRYNGRELLRQTKFMYIPKLDKTVCTFHRSKAGIPSKKEVWLQGLGFERIPEDVLEKEIGLC